MELRPGCIYLFPVWLMPCSLICAGCESLQKFRVLFALFLAALFYGCILPQAGPKVSPASGADSAFVGSWRVFSERIYFDIGGAGSSALPVTRNLELSSDGSWKFGDSKGTWRVLEIESGDWARWGVDSYGPSRKIVFSNWNQGVADGPVEDGEEGRVDFFWIIYRVEPPLVENAGTVWLKFGH